MSEDVDVDDAGSEDADLQKNLMASRSEFEAQVLIRSCKLYKCIHLVIRILRLHP